MTSTVCQFVFSAFCDDSLKAKHVYLIGIHAARLEATINEWKIFKPNDEDDDERQIESREPITHSESMQCTILLACLFIFRGLRIPLE